MKVEVTEDKRFVLRNENGEIQHITPPNLDSRLEKCIYHQNAKCINSAPAITLNPNGSVTCWSMREKEGARFINLDDDKNKDTYYDLNITPNETVIRVSLLFSAVVGDEVHCDSVTYLILEILDKRLDWQRDGFTYQKLILQKLKEH